KKYGHIAYGDPRIILSSTSIATVSICKPRSQG
ncbi:hypothetical protein AALP_AAs59683U000100, partial [Arabis alpina]